MQFVASLATDLLNCFIIDSNSKPSARERVCMGLLEHKAMPSLRDIAHGWMVNCYVHLPVVGKSIMQIDNRWIDANRITI